MLGPVRQLVLAAFEAPTAARRLHRRSAGWLAVYLAAAAAVLAVVTYALVTHREVLEQAPLTYLLPADWHDAGRLLLRRLFAQQEDAVVRNAAIAASLMVVQLTLFPLKEQASLALEQDARLIDETIDEHPVWMQAWEEIKLLAMMLAAQGTIFWIGYTSDPGRTRIALVLSYVVLFASVGIDFLSPVLQRHRLLYGSILRTLLAHPLLTFGFGALFAVPALVTSEVASAHPTWSLATQLALTFAGQVVGVALAAIGGTVAGAALLPDARCRRPTHLVVRALAWIVLLGLLAGNVYRFGAVGRSLHHKSQLLKCTYDVDWSTLSVETPSASALALALRTDRITIAVELVVGITNPTTVDVEIEDNRLVAVHHGQLVATSRIPRMRIAAGATERVPLRLPLTVKPSQALRLRGLLTQRDWELTLYFEVAAGFTFPVFLVTR